MIFSKNRFPFLYFYLLNNALFHCSLHKRFRFTETCTSTNCLRILYFVLVRSILEYGVVVSYPYFIKEQLRVKRVQNKYLFYTVYILRQLLMDIIILFAECYAISIILTLVYNLILQFSKLIFISYFVYCCLFLFCIVV